VKTELYELIDQIVSLWEKVESKLGGVELDPEECDLSMKRVGEHMKLCYRGRPLTQCKATEKIDAVFHLDRFCESLQERDAAMMARAREALSKLQEWVTKNAI
jgi:hypothetical protein